MGFYYGSARLHPSSEDSSMVITPREYTLLFGGATRAAISCGPQESDTARSRTARAAASPGLIEALSRCVRQRPEDPTPHRMLAIAHLAAGQCRPALRHLEIAVNMLLAQRTKGCLRESLYARVELAVLLPVLIPLCVRLGKRATVRRLVSELLLGATMKRG